MGGAGATMEGVGGTKGRGEAVIPDGPGAHQKIGRCVPVMVDGRRCKYLQYSMNTETGKLITELNMAGT